MKITSKAKKIISAAAFSVFVIISLIFVSVNIFRFVYDDSKAQTYTQEKYTISVYKEKIAVFAQGDKVPIEIYDVYVSTLPQKDQIELKKGIVVYGKNKLRSLIEDYTS